MRSIAFPIQRPQGLTQLYRLGLQYLKFGLVGLTASAVHVSVFAAAMESFVPPGWLANLLAFGVAVNVSFLGHARFTFRDSRGAGADSGTFVRFAVTAGLGLALNTSIAFLTVDLLGYAYFWAIPPMLIAVPMVTFLLAKFWAFRAP